jgi:hypothetical protein
VRGGGNCLLSSKRQFNPHFQSNSLVNKGSGTTTSPTITKFRASGDFPHVRREPYEKPRLRLGFRFAALGSQSPASSAIEPTLIISRP